MSSITFLLVILLVTIFPKASGDPAEIDARLTRLHAKGVTFLLTHDHPSSVRAPTAPLSGSRPLKGNRKEPDENDDVWRQAEDTDPWIEECRDPARMAAWGGKRRQEIRARDAGNGVLQRRRGATTARTAMRSGLAGEEQPALAGRQMPGVGRRTPVDPVRRAAWSG
ncbi:hypothetical protein B0H14DRAFT_2618001 [Mycena olivaceomarginata]|nr:hypothetical protein B0H14DRAFT_2618001 [Mycena olivaceomarginata]